MSQAWSSFVTPPIILPELLHEIQDQCGTQVMLISTCATGLCSVPMALGPALLATLPYYTVYEMVTIHQEYMSKLGMDRYEILMV